MTYAQDLVFKGGLAERLLRAVWSLLVASAWVAWYLAIALAATLVAAYYVASLPHESPSGVLADMARIEEAQ